MVLPWPPGHTGLVGVLATRRAMRSRHAGSAAPTRLRSRSPAGTGAPGTTNLAKLALSPSPACGAAGAPTTAHPAFCAASTSKYWYYSYIQTPHTLAHLEPRFTYSTPGHPNNFHRIDHVPLLSNAAIRCSSSSSNLTRASLSASTCARSTANSPSYLTSTLLSVVSML